MEASRQQLLPGMAVAPRSDREREPGCEMIKRIGRNATVALLLANLAGGVLTFVLGAWVVPAPEGLELDANLRANLIAFGVAILLGLVAGTWLSPRISRDAQRWMREERAPTAEEREATLRFPVRQTMVEAGLWG